MNLSKYTAFDGDQLVYNGDLEDVVLQVKRRMKETPESSILILNDFSGSQVDFDLRGTDEEVVSRLKIFVTPREQPAPKGPGRPKLGVVSREISLLPRHWEWLKSQSGGSSVALRKLVDQARQKETSQDSKKLSLNRTHGIATTLAGNFPGYEEALRALYRNDKRGFTSIVSKWPKDIRAYVKKASKNAFS